MNGTTLELRTKPMAKDDKLSLDDLPTEIILDICERLCLHCCVDRVAEAAPDKIDAGFKNQKALSSLSKCFRKQKAIVQPFVFHWYHSHGFRGDGDYARMRPRVVKFVHALILRPDLARSVKALDMYLASTDSTIYNTALAPSESEVPGFQNAFRQAVTALGPFLASRPWAMAGLFRCQQLAVALSFAAEHLCFSWLSAGSNSYWAGWDHALDNVTYLALPGLRKINETRSKTYHISQARGLLRQCTNLEVLVAADCGSCTFDGDIRHHGRQEWELQAWDVDMPKLKELSINGVTIAYLATITQRCPALDDLEYFEDSSNSTWIEFRDTAHHLPIIASNLRRLCFSTTAVSPEQMRESSSSRIRHELPYDLTPDGRRIWDDLDYYHQPVEARGIIAISSVMWNRLGLSFALCTRLETLEVEDFVLHERGQSPAIPFISKLPPNLRHLRLGHITYRDVVYPLMMELAVEADSFQNLESVMLELGYLTHKHYEDDFRRLAEAFRPAGVTVTICYSTRTWMSRGLLPARPGHKELIPIRFFP